MKKIRNLAHERPILFCLVLSVFVTMCSMGTAWFSGLFPWTLLNYFCSTVFGMVWPVALTLALGYGYIFRKGSFGASLVAGLPSLALRLFLMIIFIAPVFTRETHWVSLPVALTGVLSTFSVGFWEEMIFRGVIGSTLARKYATDAKGMWFTVILSAVIFSAIHLQSLAYGVSPTAMAAQLTGAFGMGLVLGAIYLRGGSFWFIALLHSIVDIPGTFEATFTVTTANLVDSIGKLNFSSILGLLPIHIAYTVFLLRKSRQPAIFARLEQLRREIQM